MNNRAMLLGFMLMLFFLNSCSGLPPTRMESYLGVAPKGTQSKNPRKEPSTQDKKVGSRIVGVE